MAITADQVEALLTKMARQPIWQIMREEEEARGWTVVLPGSVPWFPAADWHATDVVSRKGNEVRIVAILARRPHTGAFRRMVDGIIAAGLAPVVSTPFEEMAAILTRWGWKSRLRGSGVDIEETWRPKAGWK